MPETKFTVPEIIAMCDPFPDTGAEPLWKHLTVNKRTPDYWKRAGIPETHWDAIIARVWGISKVKLTVQQIYDANKIARSEAPPPGA